MKIAIIGSGRVGGTLGSRWAKNGHTVFFGSREPGSEKMQALLAEIGLYASAHSLPEAAAQAEVVLLATPWAAARETVDALGDLGGKVLVDATNPIGADGQLTLGHTTSGAEQVAVWAGGARVVKAFNSTGAGNMRNPDYHGLKPVMFLCGDDDAACLLVSGLAAELGFEPVIAGGLSMARTLEPLAMLWIRLAYTRGMGADVAFSLLKR
jgi:predicted dinucleotide-binding enzyme